MAAVRNNNGESKSRYPIHDWRQSHDEEFPDGAFQFDESNRDAS
jgi:hypothetical protein